MTAAWLISAIVAGMSSQPCGFQTALDDVAAAAGLTKGAVYSNFTGKADLLLELMRRRQGEDVVDADPEDVPGELFGIAMQLIHDQPTR